ncbi:DUF92 domain-containing protein [Marinicrinis sediminis]|uniref:DUF92 domain-containing protein n=1 Tax=Marinicrinis sediminis TaxID=1652465 RepID=A0ABW5R7N8_9BACL
MMISWGVGLLFSGIVARYAYRRRMLTASGMVAAIILGTGLYALGTPAWYGSLLAFFFSSSLLSKWKRHRKGHAKKHDEKGSTRDAGQVWANGGAALIACMLYAWTGQPEWGLAFVGALATVNADTWATEIGGLSRRQPIHILTGKRVPRGTSGGISMLGTLAAAAGALLIGISFILLQQLTEKESLFEWDAASIVILLFIAACSGLVGAMVDSMLGATVQRMFRCTVCGQSTEKQTHCEQATVHFRGLGWMNNDAVNAISSISGALAAIGLGILLL